MGLVTQPDVRPTARPEPGAEAGAQAGAGTPAREVVEDPRLTAIGLFAETYTALEARLTRQVAEHGLAPAEFEVLIRLVRSEGLLRMSDLAAQTALTTSGITRVVDRLTDRGLVARQACATDRRATYAVVTDNGRALVAAVLPGHLELVEAWLTGPLAAFGELEAFTAMLRRLRDHAAPGATAGIEGTALPGQLSGAAARAGS